MAGKIISFRKKKNEIKARKEAKNKATAADVGYTIHGADRAAEAFNRFEESIRNACYPGTLRLKTTPNLVVDNEK